MVRDSLLARMKTAPASPKPTGALARKLGASKKAIGGSTAVRNARSGKPVVKKAPIKTAPIPARISYDASDIEEANRIGAALCRQHAR